MVKSFKVSVRRGVTLVELMIAMLILAIVCVAWLEIIGIQSARKEARRREAVERLAGMMDAFMYTYKTKLPSGDSFYMTPKNPNAGDTIDFKPAQKDEVEPMFDGDVSPIGYELCVVATSRLPYLPGSNNNWGGNLKWLVGKIYNHHGNKKENVVGEPFFVLQVCLGLK